MQITEVFNEEEQDFLFAGLNVLLGQKREAMQVLNASELRPGDRMWEPSDFGIPQIEALIARFNAE